MRNLTISVDETVARWARVAAAERDVSVSRFVADLLRERMQEEVAYDAARARDVARPARALKSASARYPSRDDLHE
jgi:hypothetical protein